MGEKKMRQRFTFLYAVFALIFLGKPAVAALLPQYKITDIGTLGGRSSGAYALNDRGQVVGWSDIGDGFSSHAFLWDSVHGMIDLGTLPGEDLSCALAINDCGVVVGTSGSGDEFIPFVSDSTKGIRSLDGLGGRSGEAWGINNAGQVVGSLWGGPSSAFLWDSDDGMTDLGVRGATAAWGVNNASQVVGSLLTGTVDHHAFIWDSTNGVRDLATLGGNESDALGINDAGQVVGWAETATGEWHAFLWESDAGMITLGRGIAHSINDSGQVVGALGNSGPAFYWYRDTGMVRLDELLVRGSGWLELSFAFDINNRGQIVGEGITGEGERHAFLMTPIPEPATVLLLAAGSLVRIRRRE